MRLSRSLAPLAFALTLVIACTASAQDRARALGAPHPSSAAPRATAPRTTAPRDPAPPPRTSARLPDETPPPQPTTQPGEVQELRAIGPSSGAQRRVFGDGLRDTVAWDDPELDVEPRGHVHLVLSLAGSYYGSTESFVEAFGGWFSVALDVLLEPRTSLHLRLGASLAARTDAWQLFGLEERRSAILSVRGVALVGVHLAQIVALRAGLELGEGFTWHGDGVYGGLGLAFVGQAGVRLAGGRFEIGVEAAGELREGVRDTLGMVSGGVQELAPRLSVVLGVTL